MTTSTLPQALDAVVPAQPGLMGAAAAISAAYRSGSVPSLPVLSTDLAVAAYAHARMPATHAAWRHVLSELQRAVPSLQVRSLADLGSGTGAAAWAAAETWDLDAVTGYEQSLPARTLARQLAAVGPAGLPGASWVDWRVGEGSISSEPAPADLATAGYVLAELTPAAGRIVVDTLIATAATVVVVEPGTPAGWQRILTARAQLLAAGMTIAAPCPHHAACPLVPPDWCHLGQRVDRSAVMRRAKGGVAGFEDEKFSYVAATRLPVARPDARVIRHPLTRKGLRDLVVCRSDGTAGPLRVTRSSPMYGQARRLDWGAGLDYGNTSGGG